MKKIIAMVSLFLGLIALPTMVFADTYTVKMEIQCGKLR